VRTRVAGEGPETGEVGRDAKGNLPEIYSTMMGEFEEKTIRRKKQNNQKGETT